MAVKIVSAIVAVLLLSAYLLAPVYKLREVDLGVAQLRAAGGVERVVLRAESARLRERG